MRALREGHLRSFTANHGQPKPLLNRCVLRMSCSSQALDAPVRFRSPALIEKFSFRFNSVPLSVMPKVRVLHACHHRPDENTRQPFVTVVTLLRRSTSLASSDSAQRAACDYGMEDLGFESLRIVELVAGQCQAPTEGVFFLRPTSPDQQGQRHYARPQAVLDGTRSDGHTWSHPAADQCPEHVSW
jgi:hypothetical protein